MTETELHPSAPFSHHPPSASSTESSPSTATSTNGFVSTSSTSSDGTATAAASSPSLMAALSATIAKETAVLDEYFRSQPGAQPSFDQDAPLHYPHLPVEIQRARYEVLRATTELKDLVAGPTESLRYMAWNYNDQISLNGILRFDIATSFPIGTTSTYPEISAKTGVDEMNLKRIMHHAMTNRIFSEPTPGVVAHTAASRVLVEDAILRDWVAMNVDEIMTASTKTLEAMEAYPGSQEMTQCGFQIANGTANVEPMFATLGKSPKRARRFGQAMSSFSNGEGYESRYAVENYDWARVDRLGGTVVDVGGSHGFVCEEVARSFPNINFVVQDLPRTVSSAPDLSREFGKRILFQAHDFNTVQPVKGADVYFFRWIFHNQPDKYAINLIKQLIPALKRGARVVINDHCLPTEVGQEAAWDEKIIRTMDMIMLTLLNAQERTSQEFETLFAKADPGFKFTGVTRPAGCRMGIVEAIWEGEDFGGADTKNGAREE